MASRILIFTASIGAGHDLPAEILAAALRGRGATADVVDGLDVMGPVARGIVGGASSLETRAGNLAFEAGYVLGTRVAPMRRAGSRFIELVAGRRMAAYLGSHPADAIVSTYPLTTELLGRLRLAGQLHVATVSAVTDLAALHYWAHPGIDLHLVTHPESEPEVRAIAGPQARIEAVHGLTDPRFEDPPLRADARTELGLLPSKSVAVISGGGWGIGDLRGATNTARQSGADTIIVLAGSNEGARARLEAQFAFDERVQVWGFTDRMVTVLAAADVLVHSTAGLTVLEAMMCGCHVISYGWPRGHVRINNRAYQRLGMATVVSDGPSLSRALRNALNAPPAERRIPELAQAADLVLALAGDLEPLHAG